MGKSRRRFGMGLGVVAAALAVGAAAPEKALDFAALKVGNEWDYTISSTMTFTADGEEVMSAKSKGTSHSELTRTTKEFGDLLFEQVDTDTETDEEGTETETITKAWFRTGADGVYEHVIQYGDEDPIEHAKPHRVLPIPATVGQKWSIGVVNIEGMRVKLSGEVAAFEDLSTPGGDFKGCLKLLYHGTITGTFGAGDESMDIESGAYEGSEWFAPGVGSVKSRDTGSIDIRLPDGGLATMKLTETALLKSFSPAK